ncbi:hypothetical protein QYM36_015361, partial [Artemia franciscana]
CPMRETRLSSYKLLIEHMFRRHQASRIDLAMPEMPKDFANGAGVAGHLAHCKGSAPREAAEPEAYFR